MLNINTVIAVAPAILLVLYFHRQDSLRPEPGNMIWRAFFLGFLAVIPGLIAGLLDLDAAWRNAADPWFEVFMTSFVSAALLEEVSKVIVFLLFVWNNPFFDEITDGIIYMAIISLGFACVENYFYSANNAAVGLIRAFTAVPGHAIWSGIMGFFLGLAKFRPRFRHLYFSVGLLVGVFFHGIYDFFLFAANNERLKEQYSWMALLIIPLLLLGVFWIHMLLRRTKKLDKEMLGVPKPPPPVGPATG